MKIEKTKTQVILSNKDGSYHFSIEEFNKLGEKAAIELAKKQIEKKSQNESITEEKYSAEVLHNKYGFCEEGMQEFAQICGLDVEGEYTAKELYDALELEALKKYPDEIIQIFGKRTLDKFGGVEGVLAEDTISLVLREEFIDAKTLHLLACDFAEDVLPIFEEKYPEDNRPRRAIEVKRLWIEEEYASE